MVFGFSTAGPIFLMWLAPKQYEASLARGKDQAYIGQVMLKPEPSLVLWFVGQHFTALYLSPVSEDP